MDYLAILGAYVTFDPDLLWFQRCKVAIVCVYRCIDSPIAASPPLFRGTLDMTGIS